MGARITFLPVLDPHTFVAMNDLLEDLVHVSQFVSESSQASLSARADGGAAVSALLPMLEISQYHVAAADFAGPVAYIPRLTDERAPDAAVVFLTATGRLLSQHINENLLRLDEEVVMCGWTQRQTLVILMSNAEAFFYHGPMDRNPTAWPLAMLQAGDSINFGCMGLHESMLAFVTSDLNLFVSNNLDSDEPIGVAYEELRFLDSTRPPTCMAVLGQNNGGYRGQAIMSSSQKNFKSSKPRVVLPCIGMGLVEVGSTGITETHTTGKWRDSTVIAMSAHTEQNTICVCTEDLLASVHRLDANFTELMSVRIEEFVGGYGQRPIQLAWLPQVSSFSSSSASLLDSDEEDEVSDTDCKGFLVLSFREPPWAPTGWGVLILDAAGDSMVRDYDAEQIYLVQEVDGVRIVVLSSSGMPSSDDELLRAIPPCTMSIFRPGSVEPGAMLTDALDALDERDPRCDATIKELCEREMLEEAVETCIEAAKFERNAKTQMKLMRAAAYGSRFLDEDEQRDQLDSISDVCRDMRVVNILGGVSARGSEDYETSEETAVEVDVAGTGGHHESGTSGSNVKHLKKDVGMALTCLQYSALSSSVVVHRLALWSLHALAIQICESLRISGHIVAEHWACERIRNAGSDVSDAVLFRQIRDRLKGTAVADPSSTANNVIVSARTRPKSTRQAVAMNVLGSVAGSSAALLGTSPSKASVVHGSGLHEEYSGHGLSERFGLMGPDGNSHESAEQSGGSLAKNVGTASSARFDANGRKRTHSRLRTGFPRASLVPVAQQAYLSHRNDLVKALMDLEPNPLKQVNALINFDLLDDALQRSTASHDTELIYFALAKARSNLMLFQYFDLIAGHPRVMRLMLKYWEESGQQSVISQFLQKTNVHAIAGRYLMQDALRIDALDFEQRDQVTAMSAQAFRKAGPGSEFFVEVAEERIALEREQRKLSHKLVGGSLRQTIFNAVQRREFELADALAMKFKLRPRCYLLTKVKALVAGHAWSDLDAMSNERAVQKELGLFVFFRACYEMQNMQAATGYAIRIRNPEEQLEAFVMLEAWDEAADIALEMRNEDARVDAMNMIVQRCRDPSVRPRIIEKLKSAPQRKKKLFGGLF